MRRRPAPALRAPLLAAAGALVLAASAPAQGLVETIAVEPVFVGPDRPTGIHHAGDGSGRLFVLSKLGTIRVYDGSTLLPTPFLDITSQVTSTGVERGLHGLAFHPDYATNGTFYVCYTDARSDTVVSSWQVSSDPNVADPASEQIVLTADQPDEYHNVSQLAFGPDGYLYVGAGDGGFVGDPDDRAQDLGELLGKILRIDVDGGTPYAIPPSNPFVGVPGALDEIWAYGVRNPWRFSFDRATGDLYMGDVGQWTWEEINFQPGDSAGGENYGWRLKEGTHCYDPPSGCEVPGLTEPIFEHQHGFFGGECAVIGGFVYRGERFPRFDGTYFYGDWCSGRIWAAKRVGGEWTNPEVLDSTMNVQTFGEDEAGELYVADDADATIHRIIDPVPFCDMTVEPTAYVAGETVWATSARLVNLGAADADVRFRLVGVAPGLPPITLIDLGAGGGFTLPAGLEADFGPLPLFTFTAGMPLGEYTLICRLDDPVTGEVVFQKSVALDLN